MPCRCLPPEVWERIVAVFIPSGSLEWEGELLNPTTIRDLRSCSLVSGALLFPAQSVLFRRIDLGACAAQRRDVFADCLRLAVIFAESPHLKTHVQSLAAVRDVVMFGLISNMELSRLRDIDIGGEAGHGGDLDGPVVELILNLIGEGIRHVRFTAFYSLSYAAVGRILEKVTHLEGLHFYECCPCENTSPPSNSLTSSRTRITQLSLNQSVGIAKWLVHPGFPLDLTGLIYVDVSRDPNADVGAVLERTRGTIICLTTMAQDVLDVVVSLSSVHARAEDFLPVQPMRYPALRHLRIALVYWSDILATLPIFADIAEHNRIQEIVYTIHNIDNEPEESAQCMLDFDARIMALPLPALKRLVIRVFFDAEDSEAESGSADRVTPQSFPSLNEKGVLYLTTATAAY
ncbi:hypothetical protein C8R44DRAFT_871462 [Mycena epipterygia]|nr:hypothetical protein C8R44DRAFT_871462 [Mycena epipterygia]